MTFPYSSPTMGVLFRAYARVPESLPEIIDRAKHSADTALSLAVHGWPVFSKVVFMVPVDHDFGGTGAALRHVFAEASLDVLVIEAHGFHSSGALTHAVREMRALKMDRVLLISGKATPYLNEENMQRMLGALDEGFVVVGLRLLDLEGYDVFPIANTFAAWDTSLLLHVGGFTTDRGVEEVTPYSKIYNLGYSGAVIVDPIGEGLSLRKSGEAIARHAEVMETKRRNQEEEAVFNMTHIENLASSLVFR